MVATDKSWLTQAVSQHFRFISRTDPLALKKHWSELALIVLCSLRVFDKWHSAFPLLFSICVRIGALGQARRVFNLARGVIECQAEIDVDSGRSDLAFRWCMASMHHCVFDYFTHDSPPSANSLPIFSNNQVLLEALRKGSQIFERVLAGEPVKLFGRVVSFGLDSLISNDRSPAVYRLLEAHIHNKKPFTILPPPLLSLANKSAGAEILSMHTVGSHQNLVHFKEGDYEPYLIIDRHGFGPWAGKFWELRVREQDIPAPEICHKYCDETIARLARLNLSKYVQPPPTRQEINNSPYVFVALQVPGDMVLSQNRFAELKMLTFVAVRAKQLGFDVLVKFHPRDKSTLRKNVLRCFSRLGFFEIVDLSVHDLIRECLCVATVNSGVGSEALVYRKPIFTFGASDYSTGTHLVTNLQSFFRATEPIATAVPEDDLARFAWAYRELRLTNGESAQHIEAQVVEELRVSRND